MDVNGEAIYGTTEVIGLGMPDTVRATRKNNNIYLFFSKLPKKTVEVTGFERDIKPKARLLGSDAEIICNMDDGVLRIDVPILSVDEVPCRHIYVLKVTI
jgi:hypothetical protein